MEPKAVAAVALYLLTSAVQQWQQFKASERTDAVASLAVSGATQGQSIEERLDRLEREVATLKRHGQGVGETRTAGSAAPASQPRRGLFASIFHLFLVDPEDRR